MVTFIFPTYQFEFFIRVLFTAPYISMKHLLPTIKKQNFGRINNMAPVNGLIGFANQVLYNSAKQGVIGLTKVAARNVPAPTSPLMHSVLTRSISVLFQNQQEDMARSINVALEKVLEDVIFLMVPQNLKG